MSDQFPVYYKATRPNGTDFRTGRVQYTVGKRSRPLPHHGDRYVCGPGLLHASDVPAMSLVGGSWPCRLFEVTGKVAAGFNEQHVHKGGFRQLTVVREIDAHLALGPNGRYVAGVIERTRRVTYAEVTALCAARDAAWGAARGAAWDATWDATRDGARDAVRNAARDAVRDAVRNATRNACEEYGWGATRDATWDAAWGAARGAARDAVLALLVRDLISKEHFDCLYGLWARVIGGAPA